MSPGEESHEGSSGAAVEVAVGAEAAEARRKDAFKAAFRSLMTQDSKVVRSSLTALVARLREEEARVRDFKAPENWRRRMGQE